MHQNQKPQQPPSPQGEGYGYRTDQPLGSILRQERERYGWTLQQVEEVLRIRASQLRAMEDGRLDLLPGRVYAIGFVRAYAECLGLDPHDAVQLFKAQYTGSGQMRPELNFPVPASESKLPNWRILLGACAALCVLIVAVLIFKGGDETQKMAANEVPVVPDSLKVELALDGGLDVEGLSHAMLNEKLTAAGPAGDLSALTPAAGAEGPESSDEPAAIGAGVIPVGQIVIAAVESVWLEIRRADGSIILSRVLKDGERYIVPEEEGLTFDTGNIAGLSFMVGDDFIQPVGKSGDVRRNVALNPESLKALAQVN